MLTAICRASSRVISLVAGSPAGLLLEIDVGERVAVGVADDVAVLDELFVGSSTDQGRRQTARLSHQTGRSAARQQRQGGNPYRDFAAAQ